MGMMGWIEILADHPSQKSAIGSLRTALVLLLPSVRPPTTYRGAPTAANGSLRYSSTVAHALFAATALVWWEV